MNILTFDIEEWALAKVGGYGNPTKYAEYDSFLDRILSLLDKTKTKGTFFCTGQMAEFFPDVIKRIQLHGHEIGCHSYRHTWMNKMDRTAAEEDTRKAVDLLEQCIGEKVLCYRAPAFSIGEENKWMFEVLAGNGIKCDASIFPSERDFGGFPGFQYQEPCIIDYRGIKINEFPVCLTSICGKPIAYSGGGYFRLFPFGFVKSHMMHSHYTMSYFHIDDMLLEKNKIKSRAEYEAYFNEPGTWGNRVARYFKSNLGKRSAWGKLERLVSEIRFVNIQEFIAVADLRAFPIVRL